MKRILVAGVGNVFRGDDAFGPEVVRWLVNRPFPEGVRVIDFGARGHDLAYAFLDGYDGVVIVDVTQRGEAPGTLYALDLDPDQPGPPVSGAGHGLDLPAVFDLVRAHGGSFPRICLVGCEPKEFGMDDEGCLGLSEPVAAAVAPAAALVDSIVAQFASEEALM
jgi:hydrogenase maturation protease